MIRRRRPRIRVRRADTGARRPWGPIRPLTRPRVLARSRSRAPPTTRGRRNRQIAGQGHVDAANPHSRPEHGPRDAGDVAEPAATLAAVIGLGAHAVPEPCELEIAGLRKVGGVHPQHVVDRAGTQRDAAVIGRTKPSL